MISKKVRCAVDVRGKRSEWSIPADLTQEVIEEMRADGLSIIIPIYTIPLPVVQLGLSRPWCFMQDVWNFRNPFWGRRS